MGSFSRAPWLGKGSNPSPVPRRLEKAPVAGHPLPKGEGCLFHSHLPTPYLPTRLPAHFRVPYSLLPGAHCRLPAADCSARSVTTVASAWMNNGLSFNDCERCTVTPLLFPYSRNATSMS